MLITRVHTLKVVIIRTGAAYRVKHNHSLSRLVLFAVYNPVTN
jgi:hypothetical protein